MSEDLDAQIASYLNQLADNEGIERPNWKYDKKTHHTYYQSRENRIYVYSWFLFLWNTKPEKRVRETVWKVVSWELAHNFRHYLDDYYYKQGHPHKGTKIVKPHKDMPFIAKLMFTMPPWEVDANKYAMNKTGSTDEDCKKLYKELDKVFRSLPNSKIDTWTDHV